MFHASGPRSDRGPDLDRTLLPTSRLRVRCAFPTVAAAPPKVLRRLWTRVWREKGVERVICVDPESWSGVEWTRVGVLQDAALLLSA